MITDTSPDRQQLAIIANEAGAHATTNVYVTDLAGKVVHNVWVDKPDEWRDARALWSPDGSLIAWHHNFTRGLLGTHPCYGIGMARLTAEGTWNARLQPAADTFVTALAWSPNGTHLLCARVHDPQQTMPAVTLYLIDEQFRTVRTLFELESNPWQPGQRELGRLADWVLVPADATSGLGR